MCNLILTTMLAMASLFGMAAQADDYTVGKEYVELSSPVLASRPGKIGVAELFWYGYPYYYMFEPTIVPWSEKLPVDVRFVCLPVLFGGIWDVHGRMFLTLGSMDVEYDVHSAMFETTHEEHKKLTTPEKMTDFLTGKGVDKEEFLGTYNSPAIKGQMGRAKKLTTACRIIGVPTMVISGKYRSDVGSTGGPEETLKLADCLAEEGHTTVKKQVK